MKEHLLTLGNTKLIHAYQDFLDLFVFGQLFSRQRSSIFVGQIAIIYRRFSYSWVWEGKNFSQVQMKKQNILQECGVESHWGTISSSRLPQAPKRSSKYKKKIVVFYLINWKFLHLDSTFLAIIFFSHLLVLNSSEVFDLQTHNSDFSTLCRRISKSCFICLQDSTSLSETKSCT